MPRIICVMNIGICYFNSWVASDGLQSGRIVENTCYGGGNVDQNASKRAPFHSILSNSTPTACRAATELACCPSSITPRFRKGLNLCLREAIFSEDIAPFAMYLICTVFIQWCFKWKQEERNLWAYKVHVVPKEYIGKQVLWRSGMNFQLATWCDFKLLPDVPSLLELLFVAKNCKRLLPDMYRLCI